MKMKQNAAPGKLQVDEKKKAGSRKGQAHEEGFGESDVSWQSGPVWVWSR